MNNLANAGTICVLIVVPCHCIKCSVLKTKQTKLLMVKIMRMRSHMDSVGTDLSVRWLRAILHVSIPLLVGMFVYREETSIKGDKYSIAGRISIF